MIVKILLLLNCLIAAAADDRGGTISGVVVNSSAENAPVVGAEVVLRAEVRGESMLCGETVSDQYGRFVFHNLPRGEAYRYRPGANRDGVHFPGPRLQLTAQQSSARVELAVCDSISAPSPLVIRRQDVSMRFQSGTLSVTETIVVDNPSKRCYVGAASPEGGQPITMQLAIPSNFERTTFQEEFFGRRFKLFGDKLVTSIPWPPGRRELKFTYILPIQQGVYRWQRPLDLPCERICVSVQSVKPEDISCNLAAAASDKPDVAVYQATGEILPKGHVIRAELGHLPVPVMAYARWLAVALLAAIFLIVGWLVFKKYRSAIKPQEGSHIIMRKSNATAAKSSRHSRRIRV